MLVTTEMNNKLITIGFLNVCSLRGKVEEVGRFMASRGITVFGVAETWLKPSIGDGELTIAHYNLHRKDRLHRHGGGVCIYYHESLAVQRRADLESDDLEVLWLDVGGSSSCLRIGCGYRPPHMPQTYWDNFESNLEGACFGAQAATVLIGDFNINLLSPNTPSAQLLRSMVARLCLKNYVTHPTRVTAQSQSLIDLFLSSCRVQGACETVFCDISDHNAVLARVPVAFSRQKAPPPRQCRKLCKVNWNNFKEDLLESFAMPPEQDLNSMVNYFTSNILNVLDRHAPLVMQQRKKQRRPCPWLTPDLVDCVRTRNSLHRRLMKDHENDVLRQHHRDARAKARRMDRQLRNLYFLSKCNTADQRKLWKVMNAVTGRHSKRQEPKATIDELSQVFGDVVTDESRPHTLTCPEGPVLKSSLFQFEEVGVDDVLTCLNVIDPHKAVGSDHVPGVLLKSCSTVLAGPLAQIVNASLTEGYVPRGFKLSHISPLFKSGDVSVAKNFRPVSLLPIVSRILEYFVKQQLTTYLSEQGLFSESQFAYRQQRSTEDAAILAINRWLIAKTERKYTGVVMIDMSKAFDRVKHSRLIAVLFSLGISGVALLWFCSYLSERFQQIKIGDNLSSSTACSRGVPQGSVLGPLLFILYIRDVSSILPPLVRNQEFADDIVIDTSDPDPAVVCSRLTTALTFLDEWLTEIGLLLNSSKTQVMLLKPRGRDLTPCVVKCKDIVLSVTNVSKYLGVWIDDELTWKPHIEHLSRKCAQATGRLWRHGRSLTMRARKTWYISMILSPLMYASNSFSPSLSKTLLSRVEKMAKSGIRAVFRATRHTATAPLRHRLNVKPITQLYREKTLLFVFRCLEDLSSPLFSTYFTVFVNNTERCTSRGQLTRLLQVPFLRGPSGRRSIQFIGAIMWNLMPPLVRGIHDPLLFKQLVATYDLAAIDIV